MTFTPFDGGGDVGGVVGVPVGNPRTSVGVAVGAGVDVGSGVPALGERRQDVLAKMIPGSARYVGIGDLAGEWRDPDT